MGFISKAIGVGFIGWVAKEIHKDNQRKRTPCLFTDNITEEEFENIAYKAKKKIKRIEKISVDGPFIRATVSSQSGISEWKFKIDFNDWGHITGNYWTESENDDSQIPKKFGSIMQEEIFKIIYSH